MSGLLSTETSRFIARSVVIVLITTLIGALLLHPGGSPEQNVIQAWNWAVSAVTTLVEGIDFL